MTRVMRAPTGEGITVLSQGAFGEHVAALLSGNARWPVIEVNSVIDAFKTDSLAVVIALWRPCPALCEEADVLAFRQQRPWLPVVMDHPHVRVGPMVMPGYGACFACFTARSDQHDDQPDITAALRAAFDRDPGFGPGGHLDYHARLAAALSMVVLGDLSGNWMAAAAAQVITSGVYRSDLRRHPVIARQSCSRCGSPREAVSSTVADLLRGIAAYRQARHTPSLTAATEDTSYGP